MGGEPRNFDHVLDIIGHKGHSLGVVWPHRPRILHAMAPRAYRPAEGGERACMSYTANTDGKCWLILKIELAQILLKMQ